MSKLETFTSSMNEMQILKGKILSLTGSGHKIVCESGLVWITQDGDLRDIVLSAGKSLIITTRGLTLINAIETSKVVIGDEAPSPRDRVVETVSKEQQEQRQSALVKGESAVNTS